MATWIKAIIVVGLTGLMGYMKLMIWLDGREPITPELKAFRKKRCQRCPYRRGAVAYEREPCEKMPAPNCYFNYGLEEPEVEVLPDLAGMNERLHQIG